MTTPTDPHSKDPWGNGGDPVVGPTVPPVLTGPDGLPIPPTTPNDPSVKRVVVDPPPAPLHDRVTAAEDSITNIGTGVLVTGALAAVAVILVLIVGGLYLSQRSEVHDLQAHFTASDTERARVDGIRRDATCTVIRALRSTNSTSARDAYPGGHGPYDQLFAQLTKAAVTDNCDAG